MSKTDWKHEMSAAERYFFYALIAYGLLFFVLAAGVVFAKVDSNQQISQVRTMVTQQTEETFVNRSVTCRLLIAEGVRLDPQGPCYDKRVLRYYDPLSPRYGNP